MLICENKNRRQVAVVGRGSWHQGGGEIMRNRRQVVVAGRCDHETQGLLIKTDAARWPIERWNHGLVQQSGHTLAEEFFQARVHRKDLGTRLSRGTAQREQLFRWFGRANGFCQAIGLERRQQEGSGRFGCASSRVGAHPCGNPFCPSQAVLPGPNILHQSILGWSSARIP